MRGQGECGKEGKTTVLKCLLEDSSGGMESSVPPRSLEKPMNAS